ncbi:MAG TPA: cytochrome P450 [Rhodanobacteraceae bacterium]|nr:cytochrome P450 [Rhodanobacteraceae bacterium]
MTAKTPRIRRWPLGLPLVNAARRDPLGLAAQLRAYHGDIAPLKILSTHLFYLFRPEAARQVLVACKDDFVKDERVLRVFRSVHGKNVLTTEGDAWERQRRILAPAFTQKRIAACAGLMAAATDDGIRAELPSAPGESAVVDVDALTTRITMDVILRALFSWRTGRDEAAGVSRAIRGLTRQLMREFFWPLPPVSWLPFPGRADKQRNLATVRGLIRARIDERRRAPAGGAVPAADILALLLAGGGDDSSATSDSLSDDELLDNCVGLFGAGHDTSATALTWWIGLMAAHPQVAARARAEVRNLAPPDGGSAQGEGDLPLLNATLKEAMRLYPPSTATFSRRALRDVRIGEQLIRKNALVVIPIWSLHHDPRWFPEPAVFRPERFLPGAPALPRSAFMPFGIGPHFCLGQQFAMVEMAVIAARLLRHYDFALEPGAALPEPVVDLVLKPSQRLRVRFTRLGEQPPAT